MALVFLLYFVGCFGFYRTYWSGDCTACPVKLHESHIYCGSNGFSLCPDWMWQERPCGLFCEGRCCRWENNLCSYQTGMLDSEHTFGPYNTGDKDGCEEKCALENYDGLKYVVGENKCYCLSEIGNLDSSKTYFSSCQFSNEPAYLTQKRTKCANDNGQVLTPALCKWHLPKNTDEFGLWDSEINTSTKPSGCFKEGGKRYWNNHGDGHAPEGDIHLICRGAEPITVASADSTGQCPGGQQLTEFECQYQVIGYGTWNKAHDGSGDTCGCYQKGNVRYFNRHEDSCTNAPRGQQMVCKKIVPAELCAYIKQEVEKTENGTDVPEQMSYLGQNVQVMWNFVKWDPTMECTVTEQKKIAGPNKCSDQSSCGIEFTKTESHTKSWTASNGGTVSGSYGMEFEAGIPLIMEITTDVEVGVDYSVNFDISKEASTEVSSTQNLACGNYQDLMIQCYIFATITAFNTTATVSPQFWIVEEGESEATLIDCNDKFGINTVIAWEAETGNGYEARDVPVCYDTPNMCESANEANCIQDEYIHKNCPASCALHGLGPAACPSDADCGFTPVDPDDCPSPADLDKEGSTFTNCLTVFNGPPTLCQATMDFIDGSGPTEWKIRNCKDDHDNAYNIFKYKCIKAEEAEEKAKRNYFASHTAVTSSMTSASSISRGSHENTALKNKEVEKAFDVIDEEVNEFKKFNARLMKVNKVLRAALADLPN